MLAGGDLDRPEQHIGFQHRRRRTVDIGVISKADAIAYGRDYISNPDLVERIKSGAALTPPHQASFYTPGEKGYTDYQSLAA